MVLEKQDFHCKRILNSEYKLICFIDDDEILHHRSIDGISIFSKERYLSNFKDTKYNLMIIAMPSTSKSK